MEPVSRYWFKSPCYFSKKLDYFVHVFLPNKIEDFIPGGAYFLRKTSPRWRMR